jgi:thiol-disulfide isomerase/thioredoxin
MLRLECSNKLLTFIILCCLLLSVNTSLAGKILLESDNIFLPEDIVFFYDKNNRRLFSEFDGEILLVSFWATWCASCVQEMPELDILQKDFRKLPFNVIALSQDFQGISAVEQFFRDKEIRYLKIYHDQNNKIFNELKITGLPTSLLVDRYGKIVLKFVGAIDWHSDEV